MARAFFDRWILQYPRSILLMLLLSMVFFGWQAKKLEVDASAETLILEDDKDLRFTRLINNRYGNPEFLFVTYAPRGDLLSDEVMEDLKRLREELKGVEGIESVVSLLDVPLLESPRMPVKEMLNNLRTLESPGVDRELARQELLTSPIYRNLVVSPDFKTTALQVNLVEDKIFRTLLNRRNELREREKEGKITAAERRELADVLVQFKAHRDEMRLRQHETIRQVRAVMDGHRGEADLFLGGVAMASDDMITYVKNDLKIFGSAVMLFLIVTLWVIFRQIRWILIPLLICVTAVVATCGLLGMFGWEVTVISSNFVSLQIIIALSGTIHLIVRYRELLREKPEASQRELVLDTVSSMWRPCLYAVLTTIAGFTSLILCDILPVINFGWMMSGGIAISLGLTFLIFPTVLMLAEKRPPNLAFESHFILTKLFARYTETHGRFIMGFALIIMAASVAGGMRLIVENSFISYFKESTEIYQGMSVIDRQLGGTTPLDIVFDFEKEEGPSAATERASDEPSEMDDFEAEFEAEKEKVQYWFTSRRMEQVEKIHDYLDSIPEIGKVLSLGTMLKVGKNLNDGEPLDNFKLALIYNKLPEKFRKIILSPYVAVEENQVRFSTRIRDSEETLRRNELLRRIERELPERLGVQPERVHLAGLMVLYNNMLQSLFNSQILTLGVVVAALMAMFMILFQSLRIAAVAIAPSLLSVSVVLGFMGWVGIPLDMMTITIASISVGIAVDDTIHYIHRFRHEFAQGGTYIEAMHRCHASIGYAMYYTSVTIIIGFSILILSNFIPSIYFGVMTGVAMIIALVSNLTLLAQLIVFFKPLGPEGSNAKS